jgi:hypothetical protein
MSDEQDKLKLSLEPPKLFGRKKKSDAMGPSERTSPAPDTPEPEPVAEQPVVEPEPVAQATPEPEPEPEPAAIPEPEPEPEPKPAPQKAAEPAPVAKTTPAKKSAAKPVSEPTEEIPAAAAKARTEPAKKPARPRAKLAPDIEPEPLTRLDEEDAEIAAQADEPPLLPLYPAAAVTGVVVGGAMVLLIWLSLRGCEAVRGTASCSGGPGFLLLVATFVLCVLLGSALLKVFSITDPGSSSFLAVGLVAVMALLFLIDALDHWSMLIVIPILGIGGFLASVWVTKTFVETSDT